MNLRPVTIKLPRVVPVLLSLALVTTMRAAEPDSDDLESTGLEITVGITPTCPYGIAACWPSAAHAVAQLDTVQKVATIPDAYNCTAQVWLKQGAGLPDLKKWQEHFEKMVGKSYVFRGIEVTLSGTIERNEGTLYLRSQALNQPIPLSPLKDKLQWNFLKQRARGPEDEERTAYQQLETASKDAKHKPLEVCVTGPIHASEGSTVLEVREFFTLTPYKYSDYQY
jgi:galactose oxidase